MNIRELTIEERVQVRKLLRAQNAQASPVLKEIPREQWPQHVSAHQKRPAKVWLSKTFLVQAYVEEYDIVRLSVNRTEIVIETGHWRDGITWDELMLVKRECGYADRWAVEVFPPDEEVLNVANIRHLWLMPNAPTFAWSSANPTQQ